MRFPDSEFLLEKRTEICVESVGAGCCEDDSQQAEDYFPVGEQAELHDDAFALFLPAMRKRHLHQWQKDCCHDGNDDEYGSPVGNLA